MVVGAACAARARSIADAAAIGGLTHLLLDAVPHRDYNRKTLGGLVLPADAAVGAAVVWHLSGGSGTVLAGAFGGMLPDALRAAEHAIRVNVTSWAHDMAHSESRPRPWLSALFQGLLVLVGAFVLAARVGGGGRRRPG